MEQAGLDLLLLLGAYTSKYNRAVVETDSFIQSIMTAIRQKKMDMPGIGSFLEDTKNKIYKTLDELIDNKLVFMSDDNAENIYFPEFYQKQISRAYEYIDTSVETPFPGDTTLPIPSLSDLYIKPIGILDNFTEYLINRDENNKTDIVHLIFAKGYDSVFALASMLPKTILQIAMFKLRDYLFRYSNTDFFLGKLRSYFAGKEMIVQDYFKSIMATPEKSVALIESGKDFSSTFWSFIYSLVNTELQYPQTLKGNRSARDVALYQAITIILACNNYYQTIMLNERDKFRSFSIIEEKMNKPPYYYTLKEIGHFKNDKGQELSRDYSPRDLAEYFKQKLNAGDSDKMPSILTFRGPQKEIWYAQKEKAIDICENLIDEALRILRARVKERWLEIIKNYQTENTMYDDFAFEQLLRDLASTHTSHLIPIIWDSKLEFVLEEQKDKSSPVLLELLRSGEPITLRKLLGFKQSIILYSVYAELPFWYSNKFILKIIGFIKHGAKREIIFNKKDKTVEVKSENNSNVSGKIDPLVKNLITGQNSLDGELDALAEQWNQQLNQNARKKLRNDVDSIINAEISFEMRSFKFDNLNIAVIEDIAESLAASNNSLKKIHNKKALCKYIMLTILKRMKNTGVSKGNAD
jgi:hypothetical protein